MSNGLHFYLNWAKERIDEMDALVSSFEEKAKDVQADSRGKADRIIADLHQKRDEFQEAIDKQSQANEATWQRTRTQLESMWSGFETEAQKYLDTFAKQMGQQQHVFQDLANAQLKAWREGVEAFQNAAAEFQSNRRADAEAIVGQMKAGAAEAEAAFKNLKQTGTDSWSALNAALAQSRKAFDQANQAAWDVFKKNDK
ncbi:MAG TPA: hypothetical protein VGG12_03745 [Methylovirgula sp.]|jgi:hypothetical protein